MAKRRKPVSSRREKKQAQADQALLNRTESANISEEQIQHFKNRICTFLRKANGRPMSRADLAAKCRGRGQAAYLRALRQLCQMGEVVERHSGYVCAEKAGYRQGTITALHRTYGYAKIEGEDIQIFIPGRELKGAMPGDTVLLSPIGERDGSPESTVVAVLHAVEAQVSGMLAEEYGTMVFLPDTLCRDGLTADCSTVPEAKAGDKVLATVVQRGTRHSEHVVRVDLVLGSADSAKACASALAMVSGVPMVFPENVLAEAEALAADGIRPEDLNERLDLRKSEDIIFTIDGFDAKDLDDAISIAKTETGYRLGVHIADVSHYVKADTALDAEAMARGTSVYYADQVIPMLPKALSNGICSLHPDVDRLTFSALMDLDERGELVRYEFRKTVIRSHIKGVYREVNAILDGTADAALLERYAEVIPSLRLCNQLREIRLAERKRRGAPSLETDESVYQLNEDGVCVGVGVRKRGDGEELIEECMLLANEAAARYAKERNLPFVYRVHAKPPAEKSARLAEVLDRLGIAHPNLDAPEPATYAAILERAAEHPLKPIVHQTVLRSMAKADYETLPKGHFGLALADYTHFTSPIRRYPDLAIHRILSAAIREEELPDAGKFTKQAAIAGSLTEQRAVQLERQCEDCYRAEFMQDKIGECFEGIISGLTDFGIYVTLPNTVEGMVSLDTLPTDEYRYDGFFTLQGLGHGVRYRLGDCLQVRCAKVNVNSGHIDFVIVD